MIYVLRVFLFELWILLNVSVFFEKIIVALNLCVRRFRKQSMATFLTKGDSEMPFVSTLNFCKMVLITRLKAVRLQVLNHLMIFFYCILSGLFTLLTSVRFSKDLVLIFKPPQVPDQRYHFFELLFALLRPLNLQVVFVRLHPNDNKRDGFLPHLACP